jgi:16S rRNA (cytosine1402-N4)-methyltransferase
MVREVLAGLDCRPGRLYVDGTVGEGGHAAAILEHTAPSGELWGLDRDAAILQAASRRLARHTSRFCLFHRPYSQLGELLTQARIPGVAGILLDLGLSSQQLARSARGFAFAGDEPLDMRFNPEEGGPTAADLLNAASPEELAQLFWEFGEEPRGRRLAIEIVQTRQRQRFRTTGQLVQAVQRALGPASAKSRRHPATRAFQALRLAVNQELDHLALFLEQFPAWLLPGGRLAVISYHSLEDRMVKQSLAAAEKAGVLKRLIRKPQTPTPEEVRQNLRARSAKLRLAEKI